MSRSIRPNPTKSLLAAALVLSLGALTGCNGDDDKKDDARSTSASSTKDLPATLTGQKLAWKKCSAPGGGEAPGKGWECATLKAPLDYAEPDGETTDIALVRGKTTGKGKRIGSLVFNFGGPGASGVDTLPGFGKDYAKLRSKYDLVSFDPRGIGRSEGVECLNGKQFDAQMQADGSPDTKAEEKILDAESKKYNAACQKHSGRILPHVDTQSAARDMDLMREVLGDKKLHYFGISYGTELGGVYAHLFPKNVGHSVMDGVVDPTEDTVKSALGQVKGFQLAFTNYMKDCTKHGADCPTGPGGAEGSKRIASLLKALDAKSLPTKDKHRRLTQDLAVNGIISALYNKEYWDVLSGGLNEAMRAHQGNTLLALSDQYLERDEHGHYSTDNAANKAVTCADRKQRFTTADVRAKLPEFRKASPVFGESMAWGLTNCTGWPVAGKADHPDVSAAGSAKTLVIGNTGDPATPYEGARKMSRELGKDVGVDITLKGEGHGGYNSHNPCLTKLVDRYLLDSKIPASGTVCS
ncbi:alpha/beta hydrolase [Streptomyces cucumeris]|uniref:alpha/beta hydrolase n=1 Tax=Streptomyces cucumeris TaxID=2962890 RepID=UPI003D730ED2